MSTDDSLDIYLKQAEIARQRQAWDDAIKAYQIALKEAPQDPRPLLGLAQAYEAKANQTGLKPMYLLAMQEYWRLISIDPTLDKAHDGLLAAAVKTGELEQVMEEFKVRTAKSPEVEAYRSSMKKIQTLLLMAAEPRKAPLGPLGGRMVGVVIGRAAPFVSLILVVISVLIGRKSDSKATFRVIEVLSLRIGIALFVVYLAYQGLSYLRSKDA